MSGFSFSFGDADANAAGDGESHDFDFGLAAAAPTCTVEDEDEEPSYSEEYYKACRQRPALSSNDDSDHEQPSPQDQQRPHDLIPQLPQLLFPPARQPGEAPDAPDAGFPNVVNYADAAPAWVNVPDALDAPDPRPPASDVKAADAQPMPTPSFWPSMVRVRFADYQCKTVDCPTAWLCKMSSEAQPCLFRQALRDAHEAEAAFGGAFDFGAPRQKLQEFCEIKCPLQQDEFEPIWEWICTGTLHIARHLCARRVRDDIARLRLPAPAPECVCVCSPDLVAGFGERLAALAGDDVDDVDDVDHKAAPAAVAAHAASVVPPVWLTGLTRVLKRQKQTACETLEVLLGYLAEAQVCGVQLIRDGQQPWKVMDDKHVNFQIDPDVWLIMETRARYQYGLRLRFRPAHASICANSFSGYVTCTSLDDIVDDAVEHAGFHNLTT